MYWKHLKLYFMKISNRVVLQLGHTTGCTESGETFESHTEITNWPKTLSGYYSGNIHR